MDYRRRRFVAALGVFMAWVTLLSVLAAVSGRQPPEPERARTTVPR